MEVRQVMKKNKIIGIAVASAGILLSVGGAAALYTRAANPTGFGIGAGQFHGATGTVTYMINNKTEGSVAPQYWSTSGDDHTGTGLRSSFTQVVYEMTLSADYAAEGTHAQTVTMGNLGVSLTEISTAYRGHLSLWVDIDGYAADSIGKTRFEHVFMDSDFAITAEEGHTEYVQNRDIAVKSAGVQKLRIFLKFDSTIANDNQLLTKDEAALEYTLSVSWGKVSQAYESAYVVGDGNQWTEDDEFVMVPDIDNATWRWRFDNCPGTLLKAKCKKGDNWSTGDDATLEANKSYNVLWDDRNESEDKSAHFTKI